jgi:hypothetical protein
MVFVTDTSAAELDSLSHDLRVEVTGTIWLRPRIKFSPATRAPTVQPVSPDFVAFLRVVQGP